MKMFLAIYYFCYYRWCRQNSHDLNTAYTCDRYQQVQILINVRLDILYENVSIQALLQHRFLITSKESRSPFPHT
ncbi:conserved hypothetical protein [Trichinella spiralis]|uniref:hypothetical protein n=1 Tax=Trichinella spiralis TaxID=6334 RepID=UPI0001EFCB91|nr:conserved hypothetical protein [Trichinella spiralis]